MYYLDATWTGSGPTFERLKEMDISNEAIKECVKFLDKMAARVFYAITYLDKEGGEIHTQALNTGERLIGICRSFELEMDYRVNDYRDFNRILETNKNYHRAWYRPIMSAFSFTPGYLTDFITLCLTSSPGYYIDLEESDLQKLDRMNFECVFDNQ